MGEENKNVKKPAVSNAVVKKRSAGTGTKSTGGTRPGNGTKSTGSTRPGSGTSAGSAHSNRTGSGVKIPQPEAMEATQETPAHIQVTEQRVPTLAAYVQTIHQEERHSHKKEDAGE